MTTLKRLEEWCAQADELVGMRYQKWYSKKVGEIQLQTMNRTEVLPLVDPAGDRDPHFVHVVVEFSTILKQMKFPF